MNKIEILPVGTKVTIIEGASIFSKKFGGKVGEVKSYIPLKTYDGSNGGYYMIKFDDIKDEYDIWDCEVEKVEEEHKILPNGTRVKIVDGMSFASGYNKGKVGCIEEYISKTPVDYQGRTIRGIYIVRLDSNSKCTITVWTCEVEEAPKEFKVGDKVIVTYDEKKAYIGQIGRIVDISGNDGFEICEVRIEEGADKGIIPFYSNKLDHVFTSYQEYQDEFYPNTIKGLSEILADLKELQTGEKHEVLVYRP